MNNTEIFYRLYNKIQQCSLCPLVNSEKILRIIEKTNLHAKIMLIAEAMAPNQVRVSGITYFDKEWNIGNTGKMLEKFLNQFWFSVYPNNTNCVYNSEIVHCFPGYNEKKGKKVIRRPTKPEIRNCIWKWYLFEEIEQIQPQIIFLMGQTSYESFYLYFLNKNKKEILPLTKKINLIKDTNTYETYLGIPLIPIQHASWANPRFLTMAKDELFINFIKNILRITSK